MMRHLGWGAITRLCLTNMAIGGMAALPVALFNRLMTVELALPALVPGLLVALHYAVQITRPVWGHRSDMRGGRTPLILLGVAVTGLGIIVTSVGIGVAQTHIWLALAIWCVAYLMIGLGIGAAGTSFLALLATAASEDRKGAAATLAWLMLIVGAIAGAVGTGYALEPYSPGRLVIVTSAVAAVGLCLTVLATFRIEANLPDMPLPIGIDLRASLRETWSDPAARAFTGFVFLSILAFYLSELIFEPFAGHVHGLSPEDSTKLSGGKDGAALLGMISAGLLSTFKFGDLRFWAVTGCVISALGLIGFAVNAPLLAATMTLGMGNGLFVVGAIGSMMRLAAAQRSATGMRMGVFGASQALAAGLAGLIATAMLDLAQLTLPLSSAYGLVFSIEAGLFLFAALVAARLLAGGTRMSANLQPGE